MGEAVERVWGALEGMKLHPRADGAGGRSACPVCLTGKRDDRAFTFCEGDKHPVVCDCKRGQHSVNDVADSLGLPRELFFSTNGNAPRFKNSAQRASGSATKPGTAGSADYNGPFGFSGLEYVADYPYQDAGGNDLFAVVRYYDPNAQGKTFRQFRKDGNGWTPGLLDTKRVLYNLPAVTEAVKEGWTVYVVEGEQCADAVNALDPDYTATTNPMGEGKWLPIHTAALEDAGLVVVVADTDNVGRKHAQDVAESLRGVVAKVDVLIPPSTHDVADHLEAGLSLDELVPLVDEDPEPFAEAEDKLDAPPQRDAAPTALGREAYLGPFEDYRLALAKSTEAPDEYHFGCMAAAVGLVVGRRAYLSHGSWLFSNLYMVFVGPTGEGMKTTAIGFLRRLLSEFNIADEQTGSYEGFMDALSEAPTLLLLPGEFRSLVLKAKIKSCANLISGLTEAYDCPPTLKLRTRTNPVSIERPFLSIVAPSTSEWMQDSVDENDAAGGFLNRFWYLDGTPKELNPLPSEPDQDRWNKVVQALKVMDAWLDHYGEAGVVLRWDPAAKERWCEFYKELRKRDPSKTLLMAQLGQRLQTHCIKLAMIHALLDQQDTINPTHLEAAIVFTRWEKRAIERCWFGFGQTETRKLEERILRLVHEFNTDPNGRLKPKRWKVHQRVGGKTSAAHFNFAVDALKKLGALIEEPEGGLICTSRS